MADRGNEETGEIRTTGGGGTARRQKQRSAGSEFVVAHDRERGGLLIFRDATLEEVLLLLDVHHLGQPGERIFEAS
jgi:hypothetical protein